MLKAREKILICRVVLGCLGPTILTWSGCKNAPQSNAINVELVRSGRTLAPTSIQFSDSNPAISDDGSRVVFVSGRDSTATRPMLKAYKSTWPAGQAPESSVRVTQSDIGYERDARLSPDGKWVLLSVVQGKQTDLYLQSFDVDSAPVRVTNSTDEKSAYGFSPDSSMISWISSDASAATHSVRLVAIGLGSASELADQVTLPTGDDKVSQLLWIPVESADANPYVLATGIITVSGSSATVDYKKYGFANAVAAGNATSSSWLSGLNEHLSVPPTATSTQAVIAEQVTNPNALSAQIGNGLVANPSVGAPISSAPVFASVQPEAQVKRYSYLQGASDAAPGFEVRSLSLTKDGTFAFLVAGFYYRCAGDSRASFGSAFVLAPTDPNKSYTIINPILNATAGESPSQAIEAYDYAAVSICGDRARTDGSSSRIDDQMSAAVLNRNATATAYRAAYVTRATTQLDATCNLVAGDTEVWLLDATAEAKKFYPLSQNHAPTVKENAGLVQGACRL